MARVWLARLVMGALPPVLATLALLCAVSLGPASADPGPARRGAVVPLRRSSEAKAIGAPPWLERAVCRRAGRIRPSCASLARVIAEEARAAHLDPLLVLAVIEVESRWEAAAVSSRGALGLMQLRRPAFEGEASRSPLGSLDRHHPVANVRAGVRYLARMYRRFGDLDLALVAYNTGPTRLSAHIRGSGVPERLLGYPRRVREAECRLRFGLGPSAGPLLASRGPAAPVAALGSPSRIDAP